MPVEVDLKIEHKIEPHQFKALNVQINKLIHTIQEFMELLKTVYSIKDDILNALKK